MKKVFITGITKGIGRAIALAMLKVGYEVSGCARRSTAYEAFQQKNPACKLYDVDLTDSVSRQKICEILKNLPTFDILINNAGTFVAGPFSQESSNVFWQQWQLNVIAPYELTRAVVPAMIAQKQGTIVNIGSVAAKKILPNCVGYTTTKFALDGFTQSLREELRPHQIRVMSIFPAATLTDSWGEISFPKEQILSPDDIAQILISALALPHAAVVEEIQIRSIWGDLP